MRLNNERGFRLGSVFHRAVFFKVQLEIFRDIYKISSAGVWGLHSYSLLR